jgi:hypothetical protein
MSLPYEYNAHVLAVQNFNAVVSPSLPPQTTAASSAVVWVEVIPPVDTHQA